MKGKSVMASVFEKMIQDFSKKDIGKLLQECMELDVKKIRKIPLRYRLIAVGFVAHMSLEQLDEKLKENGCEQLYARNRIEATLIYAFSRGLSYEEWSQLEKLCEEQNAENADEWFCESRVTYRKLCEYVRENSDIAGTELVTRKMTRNLKEQIQMTKTEEEFLEFMELNQKDFSIVREKARYYFCKYLNYYIEEKIEAYLVSRKTGFGVKQAVLELNVLKCTAFLRHKFANDEEIREGLLDCGISFGNIYDAFNYFYFGYVSADWLEILLEFYSGCVEDMNTEEKRKLADAIRSYEKGWDGMSDTEVIRKKIEENEEQEYLRDQEFSLGDMKENVGDRGYQKNRSGEKSVRNYIKGNNDLDRTSLICYLLFFGQESLKHQEWVITHEKLDYILGECGFSILCYSNDFDRFLIQYLNADDRVDFLMESVTSAAMEEKNFYLYHMYQGAINDDGKLKELLH